MSKPRSDPLGRCGIDEAEDVVEDEEDASLLLEMEGLSVGHGLLLFVDLTSKELLVYHLLQTADAY
jgi:hypothetical protein